MKATAVPKTAAADDRLSAIRDTVQVVALIARSTTYPIVQPSNVSDPNVRCPSGIETRFPVNPPKHPTAKPSNPKNANACCA